MSFDLTNKNIKDTFQNLLQKTGSDNRLYDLEGNEVTNLRINGTLTADQYVVSSSVTNVTFQQQSGSTIFGDSSDDTHTFQGNITASGNISSSGQLIAASADFKDGNISNVGQISVDRVMADVANETFIDLGSGVMTTEMADITFNDGNDDKKFQVKGSGDDNLIYANHNNVDRVGIGIQAPTSKLQVTGDFKVSTNITASGNISSSGTITAVGITLPNNGGAIVGNSGEDYMTFSANNVIEIGDPSGAGNTTVLKIDDTFSSQNVTVTGQGGLQVNANNSNTFGVMVAGTLSASKKIYSDDEIHLRDGGAAGDTLVKMYASNDDGIIDVYQNNAVKISLDGRGGHITASGHISASGNILTSGNIIMVSPNQLKLNGDLADDRIFYSADNGINIDSNEGTCIYNKLKVDTISDSGKSLTVGGDISSSGDIFNTVNVQMTNSSSVINTFNTGSHQTCKYTLEVTSGSHIQSSEMLVVQNSSNAFNTEYAQINSSVNLLDFTSKVNGSNVELIGSSSFISCSVKFVRTLI